MNRMKMFALVPLLGLPIILMLHQSRAEVESPPTTIENPANPTGAVDELSSEDILSQFKIEEFADLSGNILFGATVGGRERIFVLDLDGRRIRRVVDGPGNNGYPSWSPDGKEFVFVSDREGPRKLFVARWDGENQRRLTTTDGIEDNPHWSPQGDQIVFFSEGPATSKEANIMLVGAEGGKPEQLTRLGGRQTVPKFSPDGRSISYSTNRFWPGWDVCVIGKKERREKCLLGGAQTYCRQDYSPNGAQMAYSFGLLDDVDLAVVDIASGKQTTVSRLKGREYDATWSPDGAVIAFAAEDGRNDIYNLYAVKPAERQPFPLVTSPHSIRFLSWTPVRTIDLEAARIREEQGL